MSDAERLHEIADAMISTTELQAIWETIARRWLGNDNTRERQKGNATVAYIAEQSGMSDIEAVAYARGFSCGLNAALNVYSPRRDG